MKIDDQLANDFFRIACIFEASLALLAILIGWLADIDPLTSLHFSESAVAVGLLATMPLLILYLAMQHIAYPPLQKIRWLLQQMLGQRLANRHWSDLLILASIAGISEEMLFRGLLQPWLETSWSPTISLLASNALFAFVHAVTPLYALLAMLMGVYLGLSLDYGGERNLLTPMIIHSAYDFFAFLMIIRSYKISQSP